MALPQLFGVIPTGCPLISTPTTAPAPTSLLFTLPTRPFSHLVVFLLPGITLPPNTAAAVYLAAPPAAPTQAATPDFKFLGAIGPGKESAVFKVSGLAAASSATAPTAPGEVDMDAPEPDAPRALVLGISIEPADSVNTKMAALPAQAGAANGTATALVRGNGTVAVQPNDALVLAQRIIKNAFNFLASYAGNVAVPGAGGGVAVEVVPLKAFENWWAKFEARVRRDPEFLMRDTD